LTISPTMPGIMAFAGLTVYVEEDVYAAMREVVDRRGATHARHWRASDCKLRPPRRNPK
jgi:hypothetical protein